MSVPESAVDHITSGDAPIMPQKGSNAAAADLQMAQPSWNAVDAASVLQSILRNGAIDERAVAQIDASTATGDAEALARATAAESAASRFELERNNLAAALQHAEHALGFAPGQLPLLLNVAYLHLRRGEYQPALDLLEKARRSDPNSP